MDEIEGRPGIAGAVHRAQELEVVTQAPDLVDGGDRTQDVPQLRIGELPGEVVAELDLASLRALDPIESAPRGSARLCPLPVRQAAPRGTRFNGVSGEPTSR